jgi:hypothetical protein
LDAFDQLNLVAEISAALLGFIAVFLALFKADGRFSESDRHFIQAMVITSALAIVYSLIPRSISLFNDNESIWRTASIVAVIFGLAAMFLQGRQQLHMSRGEAAEINWLWHVVAWALSLFSGALFVLALVDSTKTVAYYVSGVSVLVPLSLWVFIGVVFRRFF